MPMAQKATVGAKLDARKWRRDAAMAGCIPAEGMAPGGAQRSQLALCALSNHVDSLMCHHQPLSSPIPKIRAEKEANKMIALAASQAANAENSFKSAV